VDLEFCFTFPVAVFAFFANLLRYSTELFLSFFPDRLSFSRTGFVHLVESFVKAFNEGLAPEIQGTWENVAAIENAKLLKAECAVCLLLSSNFFFVLLLLFLKLSFRLFSPLRLTRMRLFLL
jgi:hypothetical protein